MRKRITKYKHLHSNRFRYLYSSIPLISASGLLVVGSMMLGCMGSESVVLAEGIEDDMPAYDTMALSTTGVTLSLDDDEQGSDLRADVVAGEVAYIRKGFKVSAEGDYNIYVQSSTGTSDLVSGTASIPTLSTNNVKMDTVESSAWGYTVAPNAPAASSLTYNAIPTTSTSSIQSGSKVENQPYSLYFAALFDGKEAAGHYRSNIVLSLAATPEEVTNFYSITYDANGSTAGITPVMQAAESNNDTYYFALSEGLDLKKSGYSFIGWAEDKDATDPKYVAGSTISLSSDKPNKTLYAVWREDKTWANITKMQELTPNTCRGLALETSKQLIDERDNKSYWVTKLKDGNCWMTQNLDYDDPDSIRITSTSGANGGPAEEDWVGEGAIVRQYWDPGEKFVGTESNSGKLVDPDINSEQDKHYLVGNYYSFMAATANTGLTFRQHEQIASGSICPSGWQLPTSGADVVSSGSFGGLMTTYDVSISAEGGVKLQQPPLYFVRAGRINGAPYGTLSTVSGSGFYWSSVVSVVNNIVYAYYLSFGGSVYTAQPSRNNGDWQVGRSIRCIMK